MKGWTSQKREESISNTSKTIIENEDRTILKYLNNEFPWPNQKLSKPTLHLSISNFLKDQAKQTPLYHLEYQILYQTKKKEVNKFAIPSFISKPLILVTGCHKGFCRNIQATVSGPGNPFGYVLVED